LKQKEKKKKNRKKRREKNEKEKKMPGFGFSKGIPACPNVFFLFFLETFECEKLNLCLFDIRTDIGEIANFSASAGSRAYPRIPESIN